MAVPPKEQGAIVMVVSVFIIMLFAGISREVGSLMVVIMAGFLLIFLMGAVGQKDIAGWLAKLP